MMPQHLTGAASEMLVASRLFSAGYEVYFPMATQSKVDLVAYRDGEFLKVQVKKATLIRTKTGDSEQVRLGGCGRPVYKEGDFDILAVVYSGGVTTFTWEQVKDKTSMCVGKRNKGISI